MAPTPPDRPQPADPPHDAEGPGPDLLAHVRGELPPARAADLERRLAASPELRAERERLAADHAAWCAVGSAGPTPRPETLPRLLAAVGSEAAQRRFAAAEARAAVPDELGGDVIALALGALDPSERERVQALVDADATLRDTLRMTRRLVESTQRAVAIRPRPEVWQALSSLVAAEGPAPVHFDTRDIPAPGRARRRPGRVLRLLPPLVAAAAAVVLFFVGAPDPTAARVMAGAGTMIPRLIADVQTAAVGLDPERGTFRFRDGDVLEALTEPLTVRVTCRSDAAAPALERPAADGTAEFVLEPGARLLRSDSAHFDLLAGRLLVTAHDLGGQLEVRAGRLYAEVAGTRFTVTFTEKRLVAVVHEGVVVLGRRGADAESTRLEAGQQGLVDADRLLVSAADAREPGAAFLTPVAQLAREGQAIARGAPLELTATLRAGAGGPVRIAAFDASVPLFLVRLKGPEGREHEVKIQDAMLTAPRPDTGDEPTWRLSPNAPYALRLSIGGLDLEPGRWEARLRYMSYRTRSQGAEWLGVVESEPVSFEVTQR